MKYTWGHSLTCCSIEADSEGVSQSFLKFFDPGVNLVVQDDQNNKGTNNVEEQVHPQDINLHKHKKAKNCYFLVLDLLTSNS